MKLKFKKQAYQTRAVEAVVDCFKGQPNTVGVSYRIDPGVRKINADGSYQEKFVEQCWVDEISDFKNADLILSGQQLLENIQESNNG